MGNNKNQKQFRCYRVFVNCDNFKLFMAQVTDHIPLESKKDFHIHHRSRIKGDIEKLRGSDIIEIDIDINLNGKTPRVFENLLLNCDMHLKKDFLLHNENRYQTFKNWIGKYMPEAIAVFFGTLLNNIFQSYSKISDYLANKNDVPMSDIVLIFVTSLIPAVLVIITIWGTDVYYKKHQEK